MTLIFWVGGNSKEWKGGKALFETKEKIVNGGGLDSRVVLGRGGRERPERGTLGKALCLGMCLNQDCWKRGYGKTGRTDSNSQRGKLVSTC